MKNVWVGQAGGRGSAVRGTGRVVGKLEAAAGQRATARQRAGGGRAVGGRALENAFC